MHYCTSLIVRDNNGCDKVSEVFIQNAKIGAEFYVFDSVNKLNPRLGNQIVDVVIYKLLILSSKLSPQDLDEGLFE